MPTKPVNSRVARGLMNTVGLMCGVAGFSYVGTDKLHAAILTGLLMGALGAIAVRAIARAVEGFPSPR